LGNFGHIPKFGNLCCEKTTPPPPHLKGISPQDSQEQKRKDREEWLG
jgi:hypothetical protein